MLKNVRILLVKKLFSIFRFSPWKSASDDKNTSYMIRLCGSLTTGGSSDCHSNTHICMTRKNDPKFTMPLSTANTTDIGIPVNGDHKKSGELWVIAAGDICPDDPSENLTSIINMKCGMTMVSITSHKILLENVE